MEKYSLKYIKSKLILKRIMMHLIKKKLFKIINYNKLIQNKLDIGIIDYKKYYEQIEIEIIPNNYDDINYFINFNEHKIYMDGKINKINYIINDN
jgi:hypothetical protein